MVPRLSAKVEDRACNSDDPPRADEVRDGTGSTETARHAAKLAGHVEHDTRLSAGAGICTPMLESVGISGTQPWRRSTSDDAGLQSCADAACGRPASTIPGALRARTTPRTRVGPRASLLSRHEAVHFAPDLACSLVISTSLGVRSFSRGQQIRRSASDLRAPKLPLAYGLGLHAGCTLLAGRSRERLVCWVSSRMSALCTYLHSTFLMFSFIIALQNQARLAQKDIIILSSR